MADTAAPFDIEKPACFYLGREYDLATRAVRPDAHVMYDARDLTTHGVVVGMTGSGKTGLCISLLEEAAIDGIPCVIIDPKGDLANLLLTFPDLDPRKYAEWVNEEDAQQKGLTKLQYGEQVAARWRQGLAETDQTVDRITRLRQAADYRIYTPGSEAGLPLSILGTFAAPKGKVPREALTQKIDATATALLGLTNITADPIQSREHILIAQLLLNAWTNGRDLDLTGLIHEIQNPPVRTIGAYNLETFFPARDRLKFASTLNNVLAAPSFSTWTAGEPLDFGSMMYSAGRPRHLIFYVAHLDDTQRMFFITLLLEEMLSWTRRQSGTTNLRALLYFDEVFGYLPPHPGNPPSKQPLLTLLKQARAFGVGVLLATQNPVDLDYKALSNAGTWFVGKLQTERDKARLLEGLESVAAETGTLTDRGYLETVISSLGNRIFLLHDIHRPKPILFQSRWALSFLRGPMTREQIGKLMDPVKNAAPMAIPLCTSCHADLGPDVTDKCPKCGKDPWAKASFRTQDQAFRDGLAQAKLASSVAPSSSPVRALPPVLPQDVTQFYLPPRGVPPAGGAAFEYQPGVVGFAEVTFVLDKRKGVEHRTAVRLLARPPEPGNPVAWDRAESINESLAAEETRENNPAWASVPEGMDTGRKLKALEKAFADHLYGTQALALLENQALDLVSEPGESQTKFQARCRAAAEEKLKQALEMERVKFRPKFEALGAELPEEAKPPQKTTMAGTASLFGWLNPFGSSDPEPKKKGSVLPPKQEEKRKKLEGDYKSKRNELVEKWKLVADQVTPVQIKPRKTDVRVTHFGLAWVPYWRGSGRNALVPAYR